MPTNNSTNTSNPISISQGGTNASSFSTSTGLISYNGTSLVSSTAAKLDSSNRLTNTSQPVTHVYLNTSVTNVTGDGTVYTVIYDTVVVNTGSNYNTSTGIFTAPVAGNYLVCAQVTFTGVTVANTSGQLKLMFTGYTVTTQFGLGKEFDASGLESTTNSVVKNMAAGDTVSVSAVALGGTKIVGLQGNNFGAFCTLSVTLLY